MSSPNGSASTAGRCVATSSGCADLGYRIAARRGPVGGYRLATGSDLPPLVFTADEAVAIAAALASSAANGAAGGGELALTALAKIEQVLPCTGAPPRARAALVGDARVTAPGSPPGRIRRRWTPASSASSPWPAVTPNRFGCAI